MQPPMYQTQAQTQYVVMTDSGLACPRCRNVGSSKVNYTLWGGFIGPRIMKQVKCMSCGQNFNGQTGKPITAGSIIGYTFATLGIVMVPIIMIIIIASV